VTRRPRAFDAVLFDFDGVLVDSFDAWLAVVNEVADRFGCPRLSRERMHEVFGQGIEEDARLLYPGRTAAEIRRAYDDAMPRHLARVAVNPTAPPALERLRAAGVRRAVVSNTQDTLLDATLRITGLDGQVDAWVGVGGDVREKPHPDLLLAALRRLGVPPDRALMVGDTRYDEEAAAAAGTAFLRYVFSGGLDLAAECLDRVHAREA
jgi:HAD superfamily hydrolase (TIGR01509 family)